MKTKNSGVVLLLGAMSFAASMTVMAGSIESDPIDLHQDSATLLTTLQTEAQGLLDYAQTIIDTGDEFMFTMDIPHVPVQDTPIVLAQASTPSSGGAVGSTQSPSYLLTACSEIPSMSDPTSAERFVDPVARLAIYYYQHFNIEPDLGSASSILLEGPKHGKITLVTENVDFPAYRYDAQPGYAGKDQVVFQAQYRGKYYKVVVNLQVSAVETIPDNGLGVCPAPQLIKVNGKPVSGSSSYDLNTIPVTFADLSGSALGQTTGSTITLDTNAAGYNWFIDTTPTDNSEFLPTSNPNEWVAKAGSAAAGKMDMLSVLLHEYGHALGIDHSANPNDFMGTTLTAGVRRLPSADEMALMGINGVRLD